MLTLGGAARCGTDGGSPHRSTGGVKVWCDRGRSGATSRLSACQGVQAVPAEAAVSVIRTKPRAEASFRNAASRARPLSSWPDASSMSPVISGAL